MHNGTSIMELVRELKHHTKTFIREEMQLAKAEMSQKLASYGTNAISIAIGGCMAYAGLIVFLAGLGVLVAFAFTKLGLDPLLAGFIGLGLIGLLVIATGAIMLMKGIKAIKKVSPTPERTVRTLQQLKASDPDMVQDLRTVEEKKDDRTPEQVEAGVMVAEERMAETIDELAERVSLSHARRRADAEVRAHPYRWGLIAAGCGAAGSYLVKRKLSKSAAR
jgi:hypothetical protein